MLWFKNLYIIHIFMIQSFRKKEIAWENGIKVFTTFIVVERQFSTSWLHPNMGHLPGVTAPVFIEFTEIRLEFRYTYGF